MTYTPIYKRPPNKFMRYEEVAFTDQVGNTGVKRIAIYLDKHGAEKTEVAQVIWDKKEMKP